ncbi:MAG TPA: hypothetical protein VFW73_13670, partial [Lacipirellulaceae bacterium]|nr:hypothetical protein [Lacipirellulaceae bacterium]
MAITTNSSTKVKPRRDECKRIATILYSEKMPVETVEQSSHEQSRRPHFPRDVKLNGSNTLDRFSTF